MRLIAVPPANTVSMPLVATSVPLSMPPERTCWVAFRWPLTATPPEEMTCRPFVSTNVVLATPPEETLICPPARATLPLAVPPPRTFMTSGALITNPLLVTPDDTTIVVIRAPVQMRRRIRSIAARNTCFTFELKFAPSKARPPSRLGARSSTDAAKEEDSSSMPCVVAMTATIACHRGRAKAAHRNFPTLATARETRSPRLLFFRKTLVGSF